MDSSKMFSRAALKKLQSPEKLDTMLNVVTPMEWLILAAASVFLLSIAIWSVFGTFTTTVQGKGLVKDFGGVANVVHHASGIVENVLVTPGERVHQGERIAVLIDQSKVDVVSIERGNVEISNNIGEAANYLSSYDEKRSSLKTDAEILAPCDGVITDMSLYPGDFIQAGQSVCSIRRDGGWDELQGVLYVPVDKAKRIEKGMTLLLEPNSVDTAESGKVVAKVSNISDYPISLQSVVTELSNQQMAQWMFDSQQSSLMEVEFYIIHDEDDSSGALWTSKVGKHKEITPGTFCNGSIIVDSKPPIERVFYRISQWLRW